MPNRTTKTDVRLAVESFVACLIESGLPVEIKYSQSEPSKLCPGERGQTTLEVTFHDKA